MRRSFRVDRLGNTFRPLIIRWRGLANARTLATSSAGSSASSNAAAFDDKYRVAPQQFESMRSFRKPVIPYPVMTPRTPIPFHVVCPPYADSGVVPFSSVDLVQLHPPQSIERMKRAARLARRVLDLACSLAEEGVTTDEIDKKVHDAILDADAYPSPLNYHGFPKSLCSSINEVICHGIPDARPLEFGDVVSFDVSCFLDGVHGDNCATVIVGDCAATDNGESKNELARDWRGVPYRKDFDNEEDELHFMAARRLVKATRESLYAGIDACYPGACLSDIGAAIHDVADAYGYSSVEKYRGHGVGAEFHCAPFVKHFRNTDRLQLVPGMIFTIEPMLTEGDQDCFEWDDEWTVATIDGSLAAQFEHTILITDDGAEILTVPDEE